MGGRSPDAAGLKSIARSLQPLRPAAGIAVQGAAFSLVVSTRCKERGARVRPKREAHDTRATSMRSQFFLSVSFCTSLPISSSRRQALSRNDITLVDVGIARQLELWLTGLCGGRTRYAG